MHHVSICYILDVANKSQGHQNNGDKEKNTRELRKIYIPFIPDIFGENFIDIALKEDKFKKQSTVVVNAFL